jgi:hypothetical protein
MQDSHMPVAADETAALDRLRLVPTATLGLAERLAGRLDGHLARLLSTCARGCWPPRPRSAWTSWPS